MPDVERLARGGHEADIDIFPGLGEPCYRGVEQRGIQRGIILVRTDAQRVERLEIILEVELRLGAVTVAAAPYLRRGDAAVVGEPREEGLPVLEETVVVVAREPYGVGLVVRDDVVVEVAVVDAGHGPVGPSEIGRHGDYVRLDARRQPGALILRLEIDRNHTAAVGSHARLEHLNLIEMGEIVLHAAHHLIELLHAAPLRHPGADGKRRAHRLTIEIRTGHSLVEKAERSAEHLVHSRLVVGIRPPAHYLVEHLLIRLERGAALVSEIGRQQAGRDSEREHQYEDERPAVRLRPDYILGIHAVPPRGTAKSAPAAGNGGRAHREIIQQRRHEEARHGKGNGQIDDNHEGKIRQIRPFGIREKQDHEQGRYSRRDGTEQLREHSPVPPARIVVNHQDAVVDDDSERDRDAGKSVDMYVKPQEEIQGHRNQQIDRHGDGDDHHIAP